MKNKNYCENCGVEISEGSDFCPNCYTKIDKAKNSKWTKVILIVKCVLNAIRYVLGVIIIAVGVGFLPNILRILLGISLLPITYKILTDKFQNLKTGYFIRVSSIVLPIFLFFLVIVSTSSMDGTTKNNEAEPTLTNEQRVVNAIKNKLHYNEALLLYTTNRDNNKLDIKIKSSLSESNNYQCALDANNFVNYFSGDQKINSIEYQCTSYSKIFFRVFIENVYDLTEINTKYFDENNTQILTSLEELEKQHINDYKKSCKNYNYKDVLRTPNNYINKQAYWFGEIVQVVEKSKNYSTFRVNVNCEKYYYIDGYSCSDSIYVVYRGSESFIEDDMIKMWGTMNGNITYETIWGNDLTVPKFYAEYIELT